MSVEDAPASTLQTRRARMFPTLQPAEVARLRRFGETHRFAVGEKLYVTGQPGPCPERHDLKHLFLFTGAKPNTDGLARCRVRLDSWGFVLTGRGVDEQTLPLETPVNGQFAIGDVRSGFTKRGASAVGEGAQVCATLHRFLADPDALPVSI
jgi:thioredoxin reductase